MKRKIVMVMAGLGMCVAVMFVNLNEANAIDCTNTCIWTGAPDCANTLAGCWCGSECVPED